MSVGGIVNSLPTQMPYLETKPVTTRVDVSVRNAEIESNSKEELAIAVSSKKNDDKKMDSNKNSQLSKSALNKRVELVQQINDLLEGLNAKDKEHELSKKLKEAMGQSEQKLQAFVTDSLKQGEEPAVLFLALKKLEKSGELSEQQISATKKITDTLTTEEEYATSIKASFNAAEVTSQYFDDAELASQFRVLLGKGNYEKQSTSQILSTLMEVGEEKNYDTFLKAYTCALAKDFNTKLPMPSTNIDYLVDKFNRLNEVGSAVSLLNLSEKTLNKINVKHDTIIQSPARLGKNVLDYAQNPTQESVNRMATEYMTLGRDKKVYFANKVLDMVSQLPMQIWESDIEKRNKSIDELIKYSSLNSESITPSIARLNKVFL